MNRRKTPESLGISQLWQALRTLSRVERRHFGLWLQSPVFYRGKQLPTFFAYLDDCLEAGTEPDRASAQRVLFGAAGPGHDQSLRLAMSALLDQLEHFLVYLQQNATPENYPVRLAAAYRERGLEKHFHLRLRAGREAWERQPYRHTEYHDAQAALEYELYQHLGADRATEDLNLQTLSDQTDAAYLARKLRQVCFALTHQSVYNAQYDYGLLDDALAYLDRRPHLLEAPAIGLYYYCYRFLTQPEREDYFFEFKKRLGASSAQLPPLEQRNLHLLAINYCIKKINELRTAYFREALSLYQSALQAELLLENGRLSHFAYNNIVAIALKVQENDWAEQFIRRYAPFLEKKYRHAVMHLNLARVAYGQRQYPLALRYLQEAEDKDLMNNLLVKTLLLKIYYETADYDALETHLQRMQTFIRRQRAIGYHRENYLNIVRFTRRLMQHNPNSRAERDALRRQIEVAAPLTEKEWLMEQV